MITSALWAGYGWFGGRFTIIDKEIIMTTTDAPLYGDKSDTRGTNLKPQQRHLISSIHTEIFLSMRMLLVRPLPSENEQGNRLLIVPR